MVGPWQVPVADCATTLLSFEGYAGEAFAIGERAPIAVIDAPASGRMAVGEALTNLAAAPVASLSRVKLSANWMAAAGAPGEDAALFDTVSAVALELCPQLGIGIPVGKDSLSMRTTWEEGGKPREVRAPLSLVVSAFAPCPDVRGTWTPQLVTDRGPTELLFLDLAAGRSRLGGSILAQVFGETGHEAPDLDDPQRIRALYAALGELRAEGLVLAYHDRSDGGLLAALAEMAFAGHVGLDVDIAPLAGPRAAAPRVLATLFNEELGVVLQVKATEREHLLAILARHGLGALPIGAPNQDDVVRVRCGEQRAAGGAAQRAAAALVRDQLADADAARQPRVGARGVRPHPGRARPGPRRRSSPSTRRRTWRSPSPRGARGRGSRCCASRVSTATSRWRRRSTGPASTRSTCT